jgi:hydroxymethylglutaryl-CoA lyase
MKILETPRDAIQGLNTFIPTTKKIETLNALLKVGFDIVDVGSFVSDKAIPQFRDMREVLEKIDLSDSKSDIFILVANGKGGEIASSFEKIDIIGFPFSTSPTFLKRNINSGFEKSEKIIDRLLDIAVKTDKKLFIYLSMAFGNPYGDSDSPDLIYEWTEKLVSEGISTISLSDITGVATPDQIAEIYSNLTTDFPGTEFGIHLHVKGDDWYSKIDAAYKNGCKVFDGVINGLGGCPMTGYELLGNLPTGNLIEYAQKNNIPVKIDMEKFKKARELSIVNWMS